MKAITYAKYGPPDVLQLTEVRKPAPKDNEVLIKIIAASVNPADWHMIRGEPLFSRLTFGLTKPKKIIPGSDVAGIVEAVGKNIKEFQPGDEVFGDTGWGGAFAEYICIQEKNIVKKPPNISFEEGASISVAAVSALQGLRDKGKVRAGHKVLINGSSGGVGTFAVQIAKYFGAEVTAVCSTKNLDLVRSIGADKVIDYTKEDFTSINSKYDLIIDNVADRSVSELKNALNPKGLCVIIGFSSVSRLFQHLFFAPFISMFGSKKVFSLGTVIPNKKDINFLKELLEAGKIKPVIDKSFSLFEVADSIRYVEKGHAHGKVIINIGNRSNR